jgi:hypothetical protein
MATPAAATEEEPTGQASLAYRSQKAAIEAIAGLISQLTNPPQQMIGWYSLFDRDVGEQ